MEELYGKKFTWVIKNFSSLKSEIIYSDNFVVCGCKWRLLAYPKGNYDPNYFSLFLNVSDYESLPSDWKRHAKIRLTVVNQLSQELSQKKELQQWFDHISPSFGNSSKIISLTKLKEKDCGYLVNDEVKVVAEVKVIEVIGKSHVLEETTYSVDVNGFQVLSSNVEFVKGLLEKYPNIVTNLRPRNQHLKTAYMNVLLSLIDTLRMSPENLSKEDLDDAFATLESLTNIGFKLDFLKKKIKEVMEKKEKEKDCKKRMREIEEELNESKKKYSDLEIVLDKEKQVLLSAMSPLSYDDFV